MKIVMTIREMNNKAFDFNALCDDIGLNPWCMNEGTATGNEEYSLSEELARKHGLVRDGQN